MDQFYRASDSGAFFKSLHDLANPSGAFREAWQMAKATPIAAPLRIAARMMDTINEPLMGQLVPRMKQGVFADMARDFYDRYPNATPEETSAFMIKAWDSVENRLGQMTYDNVFWRKMQKDIAFITTRSVGWNIGTMREIGGGGIDAVKQLGQMARGRAPELTNRMAYTIAMPIATAMLGGLICYMTTGQPPQDLLDYFYPPSGSATKGEKDRLSIPGYIKDVIAFSKAPVQTLLDKLNPLAETAVELHQNKDFYGDTIYNPDRAVSAAGQYGNYLLNQGEPFSFRALQKEQGKGMSMGTQALAFWGIQPAPASITNPERTLKFQRRQDAQGERRYQRSVNSGRISQFFD